MTKVDRSFQLAYTAHVTPEHTAMDAVRAAYNAVAQAFAAAGREPALVEVRVFAKPKENPNA